jgi:hypothetical protein
LTLFWVSALQVLAEMVHGQKIEENVKDLQAQLKDLLEEAETDHALTMAMAFGPGLTVETAVLERVGCATTVAHLEKAAALT